MDRTDSVPQSLLCIAYGLYIYYDQTFFFVSGSKSSIWVDLLLTYHFSCRIKNWHNFGSMLEYPLFYPITLQYIKRKEKKSCKKQDS